MVRVVLVNVSKRFAVLDTDEVVRLTNLLDSDGEETEVPDEVCGVVGQLANGLWLSVSLLEMQQVAGLS